MDNDLEGIGLGPEGDFGATIIGNVISRSEVSVGNWTGGPISIGANTVNGEDFSSLVIGTNVADTLNGTGSDEFVMGGDGVDSMAGGAGSDVVSGGAGNDVLSAGGRTGQALTQSGDVDILVGGAGIDTLAGNFGDDDAKTIMFGGDRSELGVGEVYLESQETGQTSTISPTSWHPLAGEFANIYQPRDGENVLVMSSAQDSIEFLVSATEATPFSNFSQFTGSYEVHNFDVVEDKIWFGKVGGGSANSVQPDVDLSASLFVYHENGSGTLTIKVDEKEIQISLVGIQGATNTTTASDFLLEDGSPLA